MGRESTLIIYIICGCLIVAGIILKIVSSKQKPYIAFWIDDTNQVALHGNAVNEYNLMYFSLALLAKLAWVFAGSNKEVYDLLCDLISETHEVNETVPFLQNKKFKITYVNGFISNKLPMLPDKQILFGALYFMLYARNKLSNENKEIFDKTVELLIPVFKAVKTDLNGLAELKNSYIEILGSSTADFKYVRA